MTLSKKIAKLKKLSDWFANKGIYDIYTNTKVYEILMSEQFGHTLVNGHAYTSDAVDFAGNYYEYKHYKMSSSNYSWTFNDISENTINNLHSIKSVLFAEIDDSTIVPSVNKVYIVEGREVAKYLEENNAYIRNHRDMINIRWNQIDDNMKYEVIYPEKVCFSNELQEIFYIVHDIEEMIGVKGLLTSNKFWELLVAYELDHNILSEQKKHDACDRWGRTYEYKVSKRMSWTFQDISRNVLDGYLEDEKIILAVVDKTRFVIEKIYSCEVEAVVSILEYKLAKSKNTKRRAASIGKTDIRYMIERGEAECVL